jgi:hypothetical protein
MQAERAIGSLVRWRLLFLILAIVLPAGCFGLFERQARRLDALGDHGAPTTATVTAVKRGGTVDYAYVVNGTTYTWNVAHEEVPSAVVDKILAITYLPEDPALSRPGADRSRGTREATSNRSFAWKVEAGVFCVFAINAVLCDVRLRRLRKTGRTELSDPRAYRTRLILTGALLVPPLALVFGWHLSDSLRRGESVWPVVLGILSTLAVLGATGFYVFREGRMQAAARSVRVIRWAAPLATGIAALRFLAWIMGWQ